VKSAKYRDQPNTTNCINVYKSLSDFAKKIHTPDILKIETCEHGFPEELFKYLTTRYSISVFCLSDLIGAEAHLKVRKNKLELQKEVYKLLKDISVKDAYLWIDVFCHYVYQTINSAPHPLDDLFS